MPFLPCFATLSRISLDHGLVLSGKDPSQPGMETHFKPCFQIQFYMATQIVVSIS